MHERIKLSNGFLSLIIMVQDYKKLLIAEHIFRESHGIARDSDWYRDTQTYYNSIDDEILGRYGLSKNIHYFENVIDFVVTDEMRSTESAELSKFPMWYDEMHS